MESFVPMAWISVVSTVWRRKHSSIPRPNVRGGTGVEGDVSISETENKVTSGNVKKWRSELKGR